MREQGKTMNFGTAAHSIRDAEATYKVGRKLKDFVESLAAKEITCLPVRQTNGEIVYEPASEWKGYSARRDGSFVDWSSSHDAYGAGGPRDQRAVTLVQVAAHGRAERPNTERAMWKLA